MPENWGPDVNDVPVTGSRRASVSDLERKHMITALLREREQLVRRGLDERIKLVDAELARYGHQAAAPAKRAERRPATRVERREAPASE
jgi:hypothetical protein